MDTVRGSEFVNLNDVWVVQSARGACFSLEARDPRGILREVCRKHFDSNFALQIQITSAIDVTHAPVSNALQNLEMAKLVSRRQYLAEVCRLHGIPVRGQLAL